MGYRLHGGAIAALLVVSLLWAGVVSAQEATITPAPTVTPAPTCTAFPIEALVVPLSTLVAQGEVNAPIVATVAVDVGSISYAAGSISWLLVGCAVLLSASVAVAVARLLVGVGS